MKTNWNLRLIATDGHLLLYCYCIEQLLYREGLLHYHYTLRYNHVHVHLIFMQYMKVGYWVKFSFRNSSGLLWSLAFKIVFKIFKWIQTCLFYSLITKTTIYIINTKFIIPVKPFGNFYNRNKRIVAIENEWKRLSGIVIFKYRKFHLTSLIFEPN